MSSSNWFLIMIGSIFMAVLAFVFGTTLFGYDSEQQARINGLASHLLSKGDLDETELLTEITNGLNKK